MQVIPFSISRRRGCPSARSPVFSVPTALKRGHYFYYFLSLTETFLKTGLYFEN
jgi:hypothetical protein